MNRSERASEHIRIIEVDKRLEFRTKPVSVVSGLVLLAFVAAFVGLAVRGAPAGDGLPSPALLVVALGLAVPAVWVLSHQRLALSADGVVLTRSVLGVPVRTRRAPLLKVGPARSLFSHAGGDESPDVYVLEIQIVPRSFRFSNECSESELNDLAHRFNTLRWELRRTRPGREV